MTGGNFAPEGASESPVATKYKVTHVDASNGKLVLVDVDDEDNLAVFMDGKLISSGSSDFVKNVMCVYQSALAASEIAKLTGGKTEFSLEELAQLQTLVVKGSVYASRANLVAQRYGSETQQNRFQSAMERDLPGLKSLLACVNGNLPVEEFVELLSRRLR